MSYFFKLYDKEIYKFVTVKCDICHAYSYVEWTSHLRSL